MKASVAIVLFLVAVVSCRNLGTSLKNVGLPPTNTGSFGFLGGDWVGNAQCAFRSESDCQLSFHVAGRRIDSTTHRANEDVLEACTSTNPSIDLVIHGFTYADIQDYSCLEDVTGETASFWLTGGPVIEASSPLAHGQPVTLTCNAPLGSPVYWLLPGPSANHQGAVITDTSNAQNASRTVTFTLQDTDHFAQYNCCIGAKNGLPPPSLCTTFTVVDEDRNGVVTTTSDFSSTFFLRLQAEVVSNPLVDPNSVRWHRCASFGTCNPLLPSYYTVVVDPSNYQLVSQVFISDDTFYSYFDFAVNTTDDIDQYSATLPISRGYYAPTANPYATKVFYNPDTSAYTVTVSFGIDSNPEPTINWFKQSTRKESIGTEPVTTGGRYAITVSQTATTQWDATLVIAQYDPTQDDAIYTIQVVNSVGELCVSSDTTVGPNYINLVRNTNASTYNFDFDFQSFPAPINCEIRVVSVYDSSITILSQTFDSFNSITSFNFDVGVDPQNTYFTLSATANNAYDSSSSLTRSMTVTI